MPQVRYSPNLRRIHSRKNGLENLKFPCYTDTITPIRLHLLVQTQVMVRVPNVLSRRLLP